MEFNKNKNLTEIWWGVMIAVIASLAWWLGLTTPIKAQLEKTSLPVTVQANQVIFWFGQQLEVFSDRAASRRRVAELEQDYSQALAKIAQLQSLETENQELRRLLELEPRVTETAVASTVTAYGQPSLNLGSEAGLKVGQPVIAAENLVGLIHRTSSHQAQVLLLKQNRTTPLLAETESGVTGLVVGDGRRLLLTEVNKTSKLNVGDLVVTSGQTGISSDLVIGRILQLIDQPAAPTRQAVLEPSISFYDVSIVEVLL